MRFNSFSLGIAAMTAATFIGSAATASTFEYVWVGGGSGHPTGWAFADNWSYNGSAATNYPGQIADAADVRIPSTGNQPVLSATLGNDAGDLSVENGATLSLTTTATVTGRLVVEDGATIAIGSSGILQLTAASETHQIGGVIELQQSSSRLRVMSNSTTFDNFSATFGSIVGQNASAKLEIDSGLALTIRITIQGSVEINSMSGTATMVVERVSTDANSGVVYANAAGALTLGNNLSLSDINLSSSFPVMWKAGSNSSAILQFDRKADGSMGFPSLVGYFDVNNSADLQVNADVRTYGELDYHGAPGQIVPACGTCFLYSPDEFDQFDSFCGEDCE